MSNAPTTKTVKVKGDKNGGERIVPLQKASKYYPAEDVRRPKVSRKTPKPAHLRKSIAPGTVLILLAGRFRGKRVVFLKQLESGLLLVTGPFKLNGVPLRRVNQAYVIATSTKVDISSVNVDAKVNDAFFAREKAPRSRGSEGQFFGEHKQKERKALPEAKASEQKSVDKPLIEAISKNDNLAKYLSATFGLSNGQHPHLLQF